MDGTPMRVVFRSSNIQPRQFLSVDYKIIKTTYHRNRKTNTDAATKKKKPEKYNRTRNLGIDHFNPKTNKSKGTKKKKRGG